jgi:hypothetical protein
MAEEMVVTVRRSTNMFAIQLVQQGKACVMLELEGGLTITNHYCDTTLRSSLTSTLQIAAAYLHTKVSSADIS